MKLILKNKLAEIYKISASLFISWIIFYPLIFTGAGFLANFSAITIAL